jgi:glycosyltransferase involved in cell wall biosynthesis
MKRSQNLTNEVDVGYLTIDSIQEGVGYSQVVPILTKLCEFGLRIQLVSFEKSEPSDEFLSAIREKGIDWKPLDFGSPGFVGGIYRLIRLCRYAPSSKLLHARSDIPAAAAVFSRKAPVLWDSRSLWSDQRAFTATNKVWKVLIFGSRIFESIAANHSEALSTLTKAVVPVLTKRHRKIPLNQVVVPTSVDLENFRFDDCFPGDIRILYSGTYNEYYDLELSRMFTRSFERFLPVQIHWAKPSESKIRELNVGESEIFTITQPEMANLIPDYSFGISICRSDAGMSLKAAMPTKIAEFLACGRPVVINKGLGDYETLIEEYAAGVVLDGSEEDLENKVELMIKLLKDPETPTRCRKLAEQHLSLNSAASRYMSVYKKMSKSIELRF